MNEFERKPSRLEHIGIKTYDALLNKWSSESKVRSLSTEQVNKILLPNFFGAYDVLKKQNGWMDLQQFDSGSYKGQSKVNLNVESAISGIIEAMMNIQFNSSFVFSSVKTKFSQDFTTIDDEMINNSFAEYSRAMDKRKKEIASYVSNEKERNSKLAEDLKEAMTYLNDVLVNGGESKEIALAIESARRAAGWTQTIDTGAVYQGTKEMAKHIFANGAYIGAKHSLNQYEGIARIIMNRIEGSKVPVEHKLGILTLPTIAKVEPVELYRGPVDDELVAKVLINTRAA